MKHLLIASDIFGRTQEFLNLCEDLITDVDVIVADPYGGVINNFKNENEAYSFFRDNVGFDSYTEKLAAIIAGLDGDVLLAGFSAGASAVWRCAAVSGKVSRAICFYGSRIRDYLEISPLCQVTLVMPLWEQSYDVDDFIEKVHGKEMVACIRTPYRHGFMNRLSGGFDETAYKQYINYINEFLKL